MVSQDKTCEGSPVYPCPSILTPGKIARSVGIALRHRPCQTRRPFACTIMGFVASKGYEIRRNGGI